MDFNLLNTLREKNLIAFNISNFVTVQDVANGINALGSSPIMSQDKGEAEEMVKISGSVTINLGAFYDEQLEQTNSVAKFANQYNKPLVLDPVGVGAGSRRKKVCNELLDKYRFAVIRGNAGEIATLADAEWNTKGIDSGQGSGNIVEIAKKLANKRNCVVCASGKVDVITDGNQVVKIFNESNLFKLHVGSGDMLSSTIGCFVGVTDDYFEAAQIATAVFDVAGEIAASKMPEELAGSFGPKLIDELHLITAADVKQYAKYEPQEAIKND